MAGSSYGNIFKVTTWGESHGKGLGVVVDGVPAGLELCVFLFRLESTIFADMFRYTSLTLMILLSSWWNIKVGAQGFHTVVGNAPRYKVEQSVTSIQQETTLCDSSQTILTKSVQTATTSDTKRTEQTSYPLKYHFYDEAHLQNLDQSQAFFVLNQ